MPNQPVAKRRAVRAKAKDANSPSPTPMMAPCGHSHCGEQCRVRYIGATSPISNHHIWHAARGVTHIWTAVIIAGLAVVITAGAAFATSTAQAQRLDDARSAQSTSQIINKLETLEVRLNALEKDVSSLHAEQPAVTPDQVFPKPTQN